MAAQLRRLPVAEVVHLSNGPIGFHPVFFLIGFLPILKVHLPVCLKVFNVPPGLDSQGSRSRPNYGNPRKSKFSKIFKGDEMLSHLNFSELLLTQEHMLKPTVFGWSLLNI